MAKDGGIPGWLGPVVGPLLGAFAGYRAANRSGAESVPYIAGGAVLGLVAGLIVWWMDARKGR
jgi:hypothetical protein